MDAKQIYELILSNGRTGSRDVDCDFDVSEILDEFSAVDTAMKELQEVVIDIENRSGLNDDYVLIDLKVHEKKLAIEFESVDAGYEL